MKYRLTANQVSLIKDLKKRRRKMSDKMMEAGVRRYFSHSEPEKMVNKYLFYVEKGINESLSEIEKSKNKSNKNV